MKETIRLSRVYPVDASRLWRALTEPEQLARWWAPGDVKPVVGHRFELDMGQWGKQPCEVIEVEPERLLRYRFAAGRLDTIMTWRLIPEATGTRLQLTHEGFDMDSPMAKAAYEGMKNGWPGVMARLEKALQ